MNEEFNSIDGLYYYPWIGNKFNGKLLIVGDSFYDDGDDWMWDKNAPSLMVKNQGLNSTEFPSRRLFNVIEKLIFKREINYEERENFWNNSAYWNLAQRPMKSRVERPNDCDLDLGWNAFLKLIEILKPQMVLKLAIHGSGYFGHVLRVNNSWDFDPDKFYEKPLCVDLERHGIKVKLLAINHPTGSIGFKIETWSEIISSNFPSLTDLIKK